MKNNSASDVEAMLEQLYSLVERENDGVKLSDTECAKYIQLVDELHNLDVEIPFGVEV